VGIWKGTKARRLGVSRVLLSRKEMNAFFSVIRRDGISRKAQMCFIIQSEKVVPMKKPKLIK